MEAINRLYQERQWADGLPIIPPTEARVQRMLAGAGLPRHEVVAWLAPAFGAATTERIAINAVMAGCQPQAMPVLVAAARALADADFNLQAIQATTNPVAIWVIVSGPLSDALGFNAGWNCLGEGNPANATVGRAVRLLLRNVGGALPGQMDRATQGQPARYTMCCAENEARSPWATLRADYGFAAGDSTVTVVGIEGTMNMNTHSKQVDELLRVFAETMVHPPSNEYVHGGEPWLMISPEHADICMRGGFDKAAVQQRLWELTKMPARHMAERDLYRARASRRKELGEIQDDTLLPIARAAKDIRIMVAGGPGTHSVYIPCFGNSRAATRRIEMPGEGPADSR
ncbi:hypothetical protein AKI39_11990 [Bordetella sp. H567]|nr:hypothetical protein AKI39_11990 [Bordetella sp. H567]